MPDVERVRVRTGPVVWRGPDPKPEPLVQLNVRIPGELSALVARAANGAGQTKSRNKQDIVTEALQEYFERRPA
ncbi:hypothetical protein [uncultured Cellulomonas sp.]|uniref:hypothetical protein n=1 Tax=uncultured Cellulomonas sp. TaxID=189682 RepID=UPI00262A1585|nr:hypothetical protein [uncultured Cellulomonas sp.]